MKYTSREASRHRCFAGETIPLALELLLLALTHGVVGRNCFLTPRIFHPSEILIPWVMELGTPKILTLDSFVDHVLFIRAYQKYRCVAGM